MSRTFKHMVGDIEVVALTDGIGSFAPEVFPDAATEDLNALIAAAGKPAIETNFNAFLIRGCDGIMLYDTGGGDLMGPNVGKLQDALAELGVKADEIDTIFLSHMHTDHWGGSIDKDGQAVFANASLILSDVEYDYWRNPENFVEKGDRAQASQRSAARVFAAYQARLRTTKGAETLCDELSVLPLYGHTPGHSGLMIAQGDTKFLIGGDIVHAVDIQIPRPDFGVVYDWNRPMAAETRLKTLEMLAREGWYCSGGHFLFPAIGQIKKTATGYQYRAKA